MKLTLNILTKTIFIVLLFLINIKPVLSSPYGEGSYGDGDYNIGEQTTSTNNLSQPSSPQCTDAVPTATPYLYSANAQSVSSILLEFHIDNHENITHYALEYGYKSGNYIFSGVNIGQKEISSYIVRNLTPSNTYYFRIRAGNGCATGNWSNEISAKTKSIFSLNNLIANTEPKLDNLDNDESELIKGENVFKITVLNSNNEPLKGALVEIKNFDKKLTDDSGIVSFNNITEGNYNVTISYNREKTNESIYVNDSLESINIILQTQKDFNKYFIWLAIFIASLIFLITSKTILKQKFKKA